MKSRNLKVLSNAQATLAVAAALILGALSISACSQADGADTTEPAATTERSRLARVETILVSPQPFQEMVRVTGVVDAQNDATISAEAGGRVVNISELGSPVKQGTVVARFDERVLKSQLDAAEAAFALAEDTYRRQEALFADSVISALEYENARTHRDQASATLEQAKKAYEDTQLTSPINGRVEERFVQEGELVAPGSPVLRIVDTRRVKVRAGVPERYAADIREGAPALISVLSLGLETEAKLTFVGRLVDSKSRTFPVEVEIDNNAVRLKPEMVVDVSVERTSLEDALVVPQTAIVRDDLGTGLYVIDTEGDGVVARRREVTTGASFGGNVVVESGISAGDQVVVVGQSNLTDGNEVQVVTAAGS